MRLKEVYLFTHRQSRTPTCADSHLYTIALPLPPIGQHATRTLKSLLVKLLLGDPQAQLPRGVPWSVLIERLDAVHADIHSVLERHQRRA